jgi:hypothetical protein
MSELFPTRTITIEYLSCTDESRAYEFNRWFKEVHIPDLLQTPGIANVYRYRNMTEDLKEGQPRYISLYRLDSEDPWSLMEKVMKEDNKKRAEQGRMIDCLKSYQFGVWDFIAMRTSILPPLRPATRLPDGMPEVLLVVPTICTDPAREKEFNDWYLYTHFHDLLETPGLVQAHRYRSLNPKPDDREARYMALYEIDSADPLGVVRQILNADQSTRRPQGRMIECIKMRYASGTYQHIDL